MTLRRLRLLTFVTPVVIVLTLEVLRISTIGMTSFRTRLILDGIVAVAFIAFGSVMVRAISQASKRQRRQNAGAARTSRRGSRRHRGAFTRRRSEYKVVDRARALVGARYGALSVVNHDGSIQTFFTSGVTPEQRAKIGP
ncbi:MAG: hypothetical protein QOI58_3267 [Thermoanaerobaculia bacterium]|jgi:hypothetical protein|nr:hypothetical protein [Thermoanaerobaculia bacterium]